MLVWGGLDEPAPCDGGSRYDPVLDQWTPIATTNAPSTRLDHSAVWTGEKIDRLGRAERMELVPRRAAPIPPKQDSWTPTSTVNAPAARYGHAAVWTGTEMLVWAGDVGGFSSPPNGRRYDPATDMWRPMASTSALTAIDSVAAVWTGSTHSSCGEARILSATRWTQAADMILSATCGGLPPRTGRPFVAHCIPPSGPGTHSSSGEGRVRMEASWTTHCRAITIGTGIGYVTETATTLEPLVYPGAVQVCSDGLNNACTTSWPSLAGTNEETDDDQDGFTECGGDCNDASASVKPGAPELCNGVDDNCNGTRDEGFDNDGDAYSVCLGDCDDTRGTVFPGAAQVCGDGINNDCQIAGWPDTRGTNEFDDDGDGFNECEDDCNDAIASVFPGAPPALW